MTSVYAACWLEDGERFPLRPELPVEMDLLAFIDLLAGPEFPHQAQREVYWRRQVVPGMTMCVAVRPVPWRRVGNELGRLSPTLDDEAWAQSTDRWGYDKSWRGPRHRAWARKVSKERRA